MKLFRNILIAILMVSLCSACTAGEPEPSSVEELLESSIEFLDATIQEMYAEVRPNFFPEPFFDPELYVAFADLDFDGIPEFFYGYESYTGSHDKIWYCMYSLRDQKRVSAEHFEYWHTYVAADTECAFFTGSERFLDGYYTADDGSPRFITETITGTVRSLQVENCVIQYDHSKLLVETPLFFSEELAEVKQAWSRVDRDHLQEDIHELLQKYLQLEEP